MSTHQPSLIHLHDVTVRLHGETIFQHLDLEIRRGEHWALTGHYEKGRTTLLETVAGLLPVAAGSLTYPFLASFQRENPVQSPAGSWHRPVSLVASRHHLSSLSRTETLFYQQRYNASAADDAPTVEEHLAEVKSYTDHPTWTFGKTVAALRLHHLLDKHVIKLSNGETRRVLLAAALLRNPALLLLESPLVGLDVQTRQWFNALLTDIAASGIALVVSTSAGSELPDAITHIADWNHIEDLRFMPRTAFGGGEEAVQERHQPDMAEIHALLSAATPPAFDKVVEMKNVSVRYGEKQVLENINWTVRQGERWALVGHNGAGKSTLLSLINGDNPQAYANHITLFDRRRGSGESIWDIKRHIGFVSPELFQYFPGDQTCAHVIESGFDDAVGLQQRSEAGRQALVRRWMRLLQVEDLADTLFRHVPVSSQRLCLLARALVKNPPLLILDEPCQGFDTVRQQHFKRLIEAICNSSNITLLYVSHYAHEIPASVTHMMQLENGRALIKPI